MLIVATTAACGGSEGGDPFEPEPPDTTDDGGTVQRGDLSIAVVATDEAGAAAQALEASGTGLPQAEVPIQRTGETAILTELTGAEGTVIFTDLLPGRYRVTALRLLTDEEVDAVGASDPSLVGVNVLGGGGIADVDSPSGQGTVEVVAGRRGSLVFSEVHDWTPVAEAGVAFSYNLARYLEVANNADTTIYLDGKIFVFGFWFIQEADGTAGENRCEELEEWRLDPEGIWSEWHLRFPGSGREHPILPGDAKVIAVQAIDHSEIQTGTPDLSGADFEVVGTGQDTDNPGVPNMIQVGFRPMVDALGRGFLFGGRATLALVEDVDLESLPTARLPLRDPDYRRFPADRILDVLALLPRNTLPGTRFCERVVHQRFDRQAARLLDPGAGNSLHRRVLAWTSDGGVILQRTKITAADLERDDRSPGRLR